MFRLFNDRTELFQWDKNQKLIVDDPSIGEVHFSNGTQSDALVCEVRDEDGKRVCDIPNILLQNDFRLKAYAYCIDYTKVEEVFVVISRAKPADYVYTETEVKTWEGLDKRLTELEEGGVGGGTDEHDKLKNRELANAHPMSAITGLNEALNNKQPKGNYALKEDIPQKTPNPYAITFTGAVSAKYDGSSAITVDIPTGGSNGKYELIETITVEDADTRTVKRTAEPDGKPYSFSKVFIRGKSPVGATPQTLYIQCNNNNLAVISNFGNTSRETYIMSQTDVSNGANSSISYSEASANKIISKSCSFSPYEVFQIDKIDNLSFFGTPGSFAIGTTFEIWGGLGYEDK